MFILFEQLSEKKYSLDKTIEWLRKNQIDAFEELVFFPPLLNLKNSIFSTMADHTSEPLFFQQLFSSYRLVARTIDSDYLFANEAQVLLLPRSHLPEEILYFHDSFADLLLRYANSSQSITYFFLNKIM